VLQLSVTAPGKGHFVMDNIQEKDWKIVRSMKDKVLDLACERILDKFSAVIKDHDRSNHAKYRELYKAIHKENKQIANMFDDFKRSSALFQIALWKLNNLITDEEVAQFSPETQEHIQAMAKTWR
jgi:nitrogen fixation/metabolism regulation signal transduction histidine kinase